jgi:tetratricopeptide (TPR) repeat protein
VWARSVRRKLPERENRLAFDAVLAWAKEDWLKLEKAASQAYAISPEFDYQALWGKALFEQGRHEEALVHLQAAVEVPVIDRDIFLNVESILQDAEQELQKKENP